jgi:hypothetical protein
VGHGDPARHDLDQAAQAIGRGGAGAGQGLEGHDDQRVAGEHRQRLAEDAVHGGLATAQVGVVEAGEIVVHERRAVDQLDGDGGGVGEIGQGIAAGRGDGEAEARADPRAAGEDGVVEGRREARRRVPLGGSVDLRAQGTLDSACRIHLARLSALRPVCQWLSDRLYKQ